MQAYTYISKGKFELVEKPKPVLMHERDAIVKVTLASICSSDLHIKHGSVPRAVPGITVGHEMVGIVKEVGAAVTHVKPGDRVTVNVETFCGECFFCKNGYVNNCTDENGGWALGCRIDGGQAEYVRVPFADQGLNKIPDGVTDRQALFVGDVLATGYWASRISEITEKDTVLIIGAGPTGICTLLCVMLKKPKRIIVCEKDENRVRFIKEHYPDVYTVLPEECLEYVQKGQQPVYDDILRDVILRDHQDSTRAAAPLCQAPDAVKLDTTEINFEDTVSIIKEMILKKAAELSLSI
jgi:alcohol dehydrogenase